MRFVIVGAGAVGGSFGASLARAGEDVTFVARGPQLEAIRRDGLRVETPDDTFTVHARIAARPGELAFEGDEVLVLATKSQDTEGVLRELAVVAPPSTSILCLQNGVENERLALRYFTRVYGAMVIVPATFLVPGVVRVGAAPVLGICDLGRYPEGVDDLAKAIAEAANGASWSADATADIMGWKYAKLLDNLSNVVQIVFGLEQRESEISSLARTEGLACLKAAGISAYGAEEMQARRARSLERRTVPGQALVGASTWQSIERGTGSVETDFLNGEVCLLGRLHGIPTPVNAGLQRAARQVASGRRAAGSLTPEDFRREFLAS